MSRATFSRAAAQRFLHRLAQSVRVRFPECPGLLSHAASVFSLFRVAQKNCSLQNNDPRLPPCKILLTSISNTPAVQRLFQMLCRPAAGSTRCFASLLAGLLKFGRARFFQ